MLYRVTVDVTYSTDVYVEAENAGKAAAAAEAKVTCYDADMRMAHVISCETFEVEEVHNEN